VATAHPSCSCFAGFASIITLWFPNKPYLDATRCNFRLQNITEMLLRRPDPAEGAYNAPSDLLTASERAALRQERERKNGRERKKKGRWEMGRGGEK